MTTSELERKIKGFFAAAPRSVAAAYLFGSAARPDSTPNDIDVAVLFEKDPPSTFEGLNLDLAAELENLLKAPVDLVVLNRAPVDLIHRVLTAGRLLFEGDSSRRVAFEVRARNEYFDLEPILMRYREPGEGTR